MIEISFLLLALGIVLVASGLWVRGRNLRDEDFQPASGNGPDRNSN